VCPLELDAANAGIPIEACYTEPIMIRLVKKYRTVLRVGLVVSWIRLLLRVKSLPLVLDRLNPRAMTGRRDEAVMGGSGLLCGSLASIVSVQQERELLPTVIDTLLVRPTIGASGSLSLWCEKRSLRSRWPCVAHVGSSSIS